VEEAAMQLGSQFVCDKRLKLFGFISTPWVCGGIMRPAKGNRSVLICETCGHTKDFHAPVHMINQRTRWGLVGTLVAALVSAGALAAPIPSTHPLPNKTLTPGAIESSLTKEKLCDPTFHTGTARHVTQSEKVKACRAYGITVGCPGSGFELDHLISIELGGSNDITNLWPQPVDSPGVIGYHTKDVVENRAHAAVCKGILTLEQAQHGIATDWYQFGVDNGFITKP
jgi:hypothetical protein